MPLVFRQPPLDLRLRHTFRIARGASDVRENLLVELEHDGQAGLGEAAPIRRYGEDRASAAAAVERMAGRWATRAPSPSPRARRRSKGQRSAEAAVDMALHDLAGRRLGVPVYELLGLDPARTPETSFTIGLDTPEVVARKVREAAAYPVLKVKMGSADDREVLTAVRDTTDRPIRVDANEGWTPEEARERLDWLGPPGRRARGAAAAGRPARGHARPAPPQPVAVLRGRERAPRRGHPAAGRRLRRHQHQADEVRRAGRGDAHDRGRARTRPEGDARLHDRVFGGDHRRRPPLARSWTPPTSTATFSSTCDPVRRRDGRGRPDPASRRPGARRATANLKFRTLARPLLRTCPGAFGTMPGARGGRGEAGRAQH